VHVVADVPDDDLRVMVVRDGGRRASAGMVVVPDEVVWERRVVLLELDAVGGHRGGRLPEAALGEGVLHSGKVRRSDGGLCNRGRGTEQQEGDERQGSTRSAASQRALDEVHGGPPTGSKREGPESVDDYLRNQAHCAVQYVDFAFVV